jgi:hypothetical protein
MLNNMARAKNCKWQAQGHTNGAFNWCWKNISLIGFDINTMGAHFNPVSFSIANSKSKEGIKNSYMPTCAGLYTMYNNAVLCANDECGFCTKLIEQVSNLTDVDKGSEWQRYLLTVDSTKGYYQLDNPSSDN